MQPHRGTSTNGHAPSAGKGASAGSELHDLRLTSRQQASVIDTLRETIAVLDTGIRALKTENAELRAADESMRTRAPATPPADDDELTEVRLELNTKAPAAARAIVASRLRDRLPAAVFDRAQLLTSELVTNGVCHSHVSEEAGMVFRLELAHGAVRIEVEDPGRGGAVAPRLPDLNGGGGFGLNLVQQLSERWGVERVAAGGTRVWAQIALGSAEGLDASGAQARSVPGPDSARARSSIGATELFPFPNVAPLAGRVVRGEAVDEVTSDALADAIAAFSDCSSHNVAAHTTEREDFLADKQAAKLRRRDNREQREREKATRTGDSPAQKAEQTRRREEAAAERNAKRPSGGGDAA